MTEEDIKIHKKRIADNIHVFRRSKGMTQKKCAEVLNLSRVSLSRIETGKQLPDLLTFKLMADTFATDINTLFG